MCISPSLPCWFRRRIIRSFTDYIGYVDFAFGFGDARPIIFSNSGVRGESECITERIPGENRGHHACQGKAENVDTAGLEANRVLAKDANVFIKANESVSDADAFVLASGTSVRLCGTFFVKAEEADVRLLFCKLL